MYKASIMFSLFSGLISSGFLVPTQTATSWQSFAVFAVSLVRCLSR